MISLENSINNINPEYHQEQNRKIKLQIDRLLNAGTWVFRTLIAYFYIANEGISLLENCVGLGLPVPQKLQDTLIQLKEGNKKEL